jgi:hypothetical protein
MMNRLITLMAAVMLTTLTVTAQNNAGKQQQRKFDKTEMIKRRTDRMVSRFDLNQTQAQQLLELNTAYADKLPRMGRRAGKQGMGHKNAQQCDAKCKQCKTDCKCKDQMEKRKSEMKANREAYEKELKKIMSDAQFSKYTEAKKQRMQRQKSRMCHHDGNKMNM